MFGKWGLVDLVDLWTLWTCGLVDEKKSFLQEKNGRKKEESLHPSDR